ncbi:MAG: glycosyltransferase family 9 protein, partial [Patescibacteria group bacterium]
MAESISYLKFLAKRGVSAFRSFLLLFFGGRVNTDGWEDRVLIINLEALGDLVVFTSVLKYYKKRFPDKKIFLLVKKGIGIETIFKPVFADEVLLLDYRKFSVNPFYGVAFINSLRKIGFKKVVNHDFSSAEINGKWIAAGVGSEEVIGYEGLGAEFTQPFDVHQRKNLHVVMNAIYPRFTHIIPSIDASAGRVQEFPSALWHYVAIYEGATWFKEDDYSTYIPAPSVLYNSQLEKGKYALLGIAASVSYKRWPLDRFAEVARFLKEKNMKVAVTGSLSEKPLADQFALMLGGEVVNKVGQTSLSQLLVLIKDAACVVTNDSSLVHLAVALKVPSVCVTGGGQFGMFSDYGYSDINAWMYKKSPCFGDNWRCGKGLPANTPSPCVASIRVDEVIDKINSILAAPKKNLREAKQFRLGSIGESASRSDRKEHARIKVVYSGIQAENYNSKRYPGFEHNNFYSTLKNMKDVSVKEYPFDTIVGMGKRRFNEKLIEFIRAEKPNLFFAFMFSDEFDPAALDKIKKLTKSIAWFADDQRRIHNYSRFWAPHFTKAVTTWSKGPDTYAHYGIKNIIRSQWAYRAQAVRAENVLRDIDVSFIGQRTVARANVLDKLRKAGIDVFVRGFGW